MFKNRSNKILTENRPASFVNSYRTDYVAAPKGYKRAEPIRSATKSGNRRHNPHPRPDWYMPTLPVKQPSASEKIPSTTLNSIVNDYRHQTTYRNDYQWQAKAGHPSKYSYLIESRYGPRYGYMSLTQQDYQTPVLESYHRGHSTKTNKKVKGALPTILEHSPYSVVGGQSTQYNTDYNDAETLQLPKLEVKQVSMVTANTQCAQNEGNESISSGGENDAQVNPKHVHFKPSS